MERALLPIKNKNSIIHRKEKILKTGACACILFEQISKVQYSWLTYDNSDYLTGSIVTNSDMVSKG